MPSSAFPPVDLALARRLERTEAHANASFVEVRAQLEPELSATWLDDHGTYALYDGAGSPLTQSFGLGMFTAADEAQLDRLDAFFGERGAAAFYEVSPLADPSILPLLAGRGYRPVELTSLLYQPLVGRELPPPPPESRVTVRKIDGDDAEATDRWARVLAAGWAETPELAEFVLAMGRVNARSADTHCFLAELGGEAIGAGAAHIHEGVTILAGASTIPAYRRNGAQRALLSARLAFALSTGCDLAMMCAAPGSVSQRNAEYQGYRIAYTRIKWGARS